MKKLVDVVDASLVPKEFMKSNQPAGFKYIPPIPFRLIPDRGKMREFLEADESNSIPGVKFEYPNRSDHVA